MLTVAKRSGVTAGALLRVFPVVLFCLSIGGGVLAHRYFTDIEDLSRSQIKLQADSVAEAIDAELEHALLVLETHLQSWRPPTGELSEPGTASVLSTFVRELSVKNAGFVFSAIEHPEHIERVGQDQRFTNRYIVTRDLFSLEGRTVQTTGVTEVNSRSLDIWFRFTLRNSSGEGVNVRTLLRLVRYFEKIDPVLERYPNAMFVLKADTAKGKSQLISAQQSDDVLAKLPEIASWDNMHPIMLLGDRHLTWKVALKHIPADVIYAPIESDLTGGVFLPIFFFGTVAFFGVAIAAFFLVRFTRKQSRLIYGAADLLKQIQLGNDGLVGKKSEIPEFRALSESIEHLMKSMDENRARAKVINKSMLELFACGDSSAAITKCVELICTQCLADTAWFEPFVSDQDFYRPLKNGEKAAVGWHWKNHRIVEIDQEDIAKLQAKYPEKRVVVYAIKFGYESVGTLKAYYENGAKELTRLMLDSLVSILEKTLARHEAVKKGVLLSTELDFAKTIQKSIVSAGSILENDPRVAQFYRPADRLGGDWFYVIRNNEFDGCYLIMGSVAGGGISQGLLTSGVKGGLDVLDHLIRTRDVDPFNSPAEMIPLLQRIVVAMNKMSEISITCFVAHIDFRTKRLRVANQRHSMPIIVRPSEQGPRVVLLTDCCDIKTESGIEVVETTLSAGDFLVAFSDGLTHAKGFKSEIFERFMISAIEKSPGYQDATALRDDLRQIYDFYTSGKKQDDDACFMVVKVDDEQNFVKSA